tara:strand:+ start:2427 stop:2903 length:477 start_codon:yes stop_codon:yes gene_type:complete
MSRKSAYTAATLTLTFQESITLNNKDYGSTQTHTFSTISNVQRRITTVTTAEATIMTFDSLMGAGQYVPAKVKYIRFTNLDDTNHIVLTFANENDDEMAIKLDAGQTFVMNGDNSGGMVDVMDAKDSALSLSLGDLKSITADADTGSCDMEIFVAEIA